MARSFQCTLVTPQRQLVDEEVVYASVPAHDGQMGVMPGRAPLVAKLGNGAMRLDLAHGGGGPRWFYVSGGFVWMKENVLTLVAGEAVPAQEMDREEAQAQLKEALARITHTDDEFDLNQRQQTRARTMLSLLDR